MAKTADEAGLKIRYAKINVPGTQNIKLEDKSIKEVESFIYLVSTLLANGELKKEVTSSKIKASTAFT